MKRVVGSCGDSLNLSKKDSPIKVLVGLWKIQALFGPVGGSLVQQVRSTLTLTVTLPLTGRETPHEYEIVENKLIGQDVQNASGLQLQARTTVQICQTALLWIT
jgi:hypothetical protein